MSPQDQPDRALTRTIVYTYDNLYHLTDADYSTQRFLLFSRGQYKPRPKSSMSKCDPSSSTGSYGFCAEARSAMALAIAEVLQTAKAV